MMIKKVPLGEYMKTARLDTGGGVLAHYVRTILAARNIYQTTPTIHATPARVQQKMERPLPSLDKLHRLYVIKKRTFGKL